MAIDAPILYLIADRTFAGTDRAWLQGIERATAAVASFEAPDLTALLQLRAKDVRPDAKARLIARGLAVARTTKIPVLLNGTEDEARELGFCGVHWPEAVIPSPARTPKGQAPRQDSGHPETDDGFLRIGAVHSVSATRMATAAGADAVVFGPVFAPGSKPGDGVGLTALTAVVSSTSAPVIAIGGIDAANAHDCLRAGAAGVAVVSAVFSGDIDTKTRIDELFSAMRS